MAIPRNLGNLAPGVNTNGVLGVTKGGTGATSLTANNVLLGNGTSALQVVAPGANGNVLTSNGTTWTSAAAPGGGSMVLISTQNPNGTSPSFAWTGLSGYRNYVIIFSLWASTNSTIYLRTGTGTGPT